MQIKYVLISNNVFVAVWSLCMCKKKTCKNCLIF